MHMERSKQAAQVTGCGAAAAMDAMFGGSVQMPDHVFLLGVGPAINASICASVAMTNFLGAGPRDWKAHIESLKDSGAEVS